MSISARVTVTVEIDSGSTWNDTATFGQVRQQAITGATNRIIRLLSEAKIIGEPKVEALMAVNAR